MRTSIKKALCGVTMLSLLASALPAFAQSTEQTLRAENILPKNLDIVIELHTDVKNPFENIDTTEFADSLALFNTNKCEETCPENQAMLDLFNQVLDNNTITYAANFDAEVVPAESNDSADDYYLLFSMSGEQFAKLTAFKNFGMQATAYKNFTIYEGSNPKFMVKIGDLVTMTNKRNLLEMLIDRYTGNSQEVLKNNATYQKAKQERTTNYFLNIYIDPALLQNDNYNYDIEQFERMMPLPQKMDSALLGENISIAQNDKGLLFTAFAEGDRQKLQDLGIFFNQNNFTPELYKKLSGKDLIFYTETADLKTSLEATLKLNPYALEELTSEQDKIEQETGINLNNDVLPLLNNKIMLTMHKGSQWYPAVTLLVDAKNNAAKAQELVKKIKAYISKAMTEIEQKEGKSFFTTTSSDLHGTMFDKLVFDLSIFDPKFKPLTLFMGVTRDGYLLISTHPDLSTIFETSSEGLIDNSVLKNQFTNPSEETSGVVFLDFNTLESYINNAYSIMGEGSETNAFSETLAPLNIFFMKGYGTETTSLTKGIFEVDESAFDSLEDVFKDLLSFGMETNDYGDWSEEDWTEEYSWNPEEETLDEYCSQNPDVKLECENWDPSQNSEDWTDSEDNKPNIKCIDGDTEYYDPIDCIDYPINFSDIAPTDWFYDDVLRAQYYGIINGSNNYFHPNNSITRAEFATMASRMVTNFGYAEEYDDIPSEQWSECKRNLLAMKDVWSGDWYYEDLLHLYCRGWMQGFSDQTMKPNAPITRAEAMQVLYKLSERLQKDAEIFSERTHEIHTEFPFKDVNQNDWFYKAVLASYGDKIISGKSMEVFDPHGLLTRAEAAKILVKYIEFHENDYQSVESERVHQDYADKYENNDMADTPGEANPYTSDIENFNQQITENPTNYDLYFDRAYAYSEDGEYEKAIADMDIYIEHKPEDGDGYYNRGTYYAELFEYEKAIDDMTKAVEINENDVDAWHNRGFYQSELKNWDAAIADTLKAIELQPAGDSYTNLGTYYEGKNDKVSAMEAYTKAVEIDPDYADAYYNRGLLYYDQGEIAKALTDFQKVLELNPNDVDAQQYVDELS